MWSTGKKSVGVRCLEEETEIFNRRLARMDEQLRRLQNHDWRPKNFRAKHGKVPLVRAEESHLELGASQVASPLRSSAPSSEASSSAPGLSPGEAGSSSQAVLSESSAVTTSASAGAAALEAAQQREQQLRTELAAARQEVEQMSSLVQDREQQIRRLAVDSSPESDQTRHHPDDTAEMLRAELAEREREVATLRQAECLVERQAAAQLRQARVELAETRRQQEILGLEMQEAEIQRREAQSSATSGLSLLQMLRLPQEAPAEVKRAHLREAVVALKQLVQELSSNEEPVHHGPPCSELRSALEPPHPPPAMVKVESVETTICSMPSIPEEDSACSSSPCSPAADPSW
ncbi:unnamed protein product [Durusdinium trenchii]|uniref:Uncharacterized protein n=2 Tax=Durusdinium trenchii TaxID=1381693 RepID=A0ABP0JIV7_9DINO